MAELVDAQDLKSCEIYLVRVQFPLRVLGKNTNPCNLYCKGFLFLRVLPLLAHIFIFQLSIEFFLNFIYQKMFQEIGYW